MIVTAIFIILVSGLFNENSKYCIMTKPVMKQVTHDDYKEAEKIIKLYELQRNRLCKKSKKKIKDIFNDY